MKKILSFAAVALIALTIHAANLTLTWTISPDDKGTNYITYNVYQAVGTNAFTNIAPRLSTNVFAMTNINPGLYRFYVTASDIWTNESVPSNTLTVPGPIIPAAPAQPILYVILGSKTNIVSL